MAYKDVEDRKAYHRNWYAQNKSQRVKQIIAYQEREREKFLEYKAAQECKICGYRRCIRALEFHHLESETKEATINKMLHHKASFRKLQKEIDKCCVLCANVIENCTKV
ncbi:MAG: hypothetical protein JO316_16080 [Abitibacteriaceae bacterium]|nr:hypothetical protein [Abditibacteriaceae bacterium]